MAAATPTSTATDQKLGKSVLVAYGLPAVGAGYMYLLMSLYIMKFSTDVLLIAPAVMSIIFFVSRVWDAISDPVAGYLSDRTKHKLGRRRSWLLYCIFPVSFMFIMVFSPPESLSDGELIAWMAVGVIGFYSAMTLFLVPHMSLGPELTSDYHERSSLYGTRHAAYTIGSMLALISMGLLLEIEAKEGSSAVRFAAFELSVLASIVTAGLLGYAVYKLRERTDIKPRVSKTVFGAYKDVWQNPHARLVVGVTFIEYVGSAVIGLLTLYVAQYVINRIDLAVFIILAYMIPSTISVPLWLPLSKKFGKIRLWIFSMGLTGVSFGAMFALPFLDEAIKVPYIFVAAAFAGLAAGCGGTIAPSVQSDIIDYDEYMTGERKEGSYFAAFNFVQKGAIGVMTLITGFVLQASGYIPNEPQTMTVQVSIVFLYGLLPFICYTVGAIMFSRFSLDEKTHAAMRQEMDKRALEKLATAESAVAES